MHQNRPPSNPRPSKNPIYVERQKQLKDRLRLKWNKSQPLYLSAHNSSPLVDSEIVKGFGEIQFMDSHLERDVRQDLDRVSTSVWDSSALLGASKLDNVNSVSFQESMILTDEAFAKASMPDNGILGTSYRALHNTIHSTVSISQLNKTSINSVNSIIKSQEKGGTSMRNEDGQNAPIPQSHLHLSQTLQAKGVESVAEQLVYGQTNFAYVDNTEDDFYSFSMRESVPRTLTKSKYMTISEHGVLRATPDGDEITPLSKLHAERVIYQKLLNLKLFRTYRLWKPLLVWRKFILRNKISLAKQRLEEKCFLLDSFTRRMLLDSRTICLRIYSLQLLLLDFRQKSQQQSASNSSTNTTTVSTNVVDFTSFINIQRDNLRVFKDAIKEIKSDLVNSLTAKCTDYIRETTKNAPSSLSSEKYNSIKMNNIDYYEKMLEVAQQSGSVVQQSKHYIYASSQNKEVLNGYSDQLQQSLSAISHYLEDSNNLINHAASVYDISYTKDLLDDTTKYSTSQPVVKVRKTTNKEPHHVSYTTRAAIRLVCRRILSVFRMVDYIMRDLLYDLLKQELSSLQALLSYAYKSYAESYRHHQHFYNQHHAPHPGVSIEDDMLVHKFNSDIPSSPKQVKIDRKKYDEAKGHDAAHNTLSRANVLKALHFALSASITEYSYQTLQAHEPESTALIISPPTDSCVESFVHMLRELCISCQYAEGLLYNEKCLSVLRPISSEFQVSPMPDRIFQNETEGSGSGGRGGSRSSSSGGSGINLIQSMVKHCAQYLQQSFTLLDKFIQYLSMFKKDYAKNLLLILFTEDKKLMNTSTEDIVNYLEKFDSQSSEVNELCNFYQVGILYIDIQPIKKALLSCVRYNVISFNKYIPRLYLHYADILYKEIAAYMDKLSSKYNSVDEYVKNVEVFKVVTEKQDVLAEQFGFINRIKEIIEIRNIVITDEIVRQNVLLVTLFTKLNLLTADFHEALENQVKVYRVELSNRLKAVLVPIQDLQSFFAKVNAMLCNVDLNAYAEDDENPNYVDSHHILKQLYAFKQQIVSISKQLDILNYYQSLLNIFVFEHNLQLEIQSQLQAYILLFEHFQTMRSIVYQTMQSNYMDINALSLGREIIVYRQELVDCEFFNSLLDQTKASPVDFAGTVIGEAQPSSNVDRQNNEGVVRLYKKVLSMISTLESYVPLIIILQSKVLTSDHQAKINRLLQATIFDTQISTSSSLNLQSISNTEEYSLQNLLNVYRLMEYKNELQSIYEEATTLSNIDNKLLSTIRLVNTMEFDFHYDSDNKSLLLISNYHVLIDDLNDHLLCIQSITQSAYYNLISNKYSMVLPNYQDYILYLKYLQNIQLAYGKYKLLFVSTRSARYLSVYMRNYKYIDDTFRMLIKAAKTSKFLYLFLNDKQNKLYIVNCIEHVNTIDQGFDSILTEFCEKHPKLYLVNSEVLYQTFLISSLKDIVLLCSPYTLNYMNITNLEFDINDELSIASVVCAEEKILFLKPCSGRNNLYDIFKTLEISIHERFEKDVRELCMLYIDERKNILLIDEIKQQKYTAQALTLVYQIQFWHQFWGMLLSPNTSEINATASNRMVKSGYNRSTQSKLKQLILDLQEQLSILYTIYTDTVQPYTIKFTSMMVMLVCYYRDILKSILDEYNVCWDSEMNSNKQIYEIIQSISSIYCNMQKYIADYPHNTNTFNVHNFGKALEESMHNLNNSNYNIAQHIYVVIGGEKVKHGLKYHGFQERLVITPLVDKFYYQVYQTFSSSQVGSVNSARNTSSVHDVKLLRSLSYELGIEQFVFDTRDWQLMSTNSLLHNLLPIKQTSGSSSGFSISDINANDIDSSKTQSMSNFSKIMRAGLKLGLWVVLQHIHDSNTDNLGKESFFSYAISALSILYNEIQSKKRPNFQAAGGNSSKAFKYELFQGTNSSLTVDYTSAISMKWTLLRYNVKDCEDKYGLSMVNSSFRPLSMPQISFKVLLAISLSSYNFVQVNKIAERLDALINFLSLNAHLSVGLGQFIMLKSIIYIGVRNDHVLINIALQLKLIVKTFLNNLPHHLLQHIHNNGLMPVIYNLHLEMLYNSNVDLVEYSHLQHNFDKRGSHSNIDNTRGAYDIIYPREDKYEETVKAKLSDLDSSNLARVMNDLLDFLWDYNFSPQISHTTVNDNCLDLDLTALLQQSTHSANGSNGANTNSHGLEDVDYQMLTHQLYKKSLIIVGDVGVGKTNAIMKALIKLKEQHYIEEKRNIRVNSFYIHSPAMPDLLSLQNNIQSFLNQDRSYQSLNIICMDSHDCLYLEDLTRFVNIYQRKHRVKCINETLSVSQIDPGMFVSHRFIAIDKTPLYSLEQLIERHANQCIEGEANSFKRIISECTDEIIKPTLKHIFSLVRNPQYAAIRVIPQLFSCVTSLFYSYCYPHSAYSEVYNVTPVSPRIGNVTTYSSRSNHSSSFIRDLPRVAADKVNQQDANKPYKLQPVSFDEDSLRRIVIYSLLHTLGNIDTNSFHSSTLWDIDVFRSYLVDYLKRSFVEQTEVLSSTKKDFPSSNYNYFEQYLVAKLQSVNSKGNSRTTISSLTILEWILIDSNHLSKLHSVCKSNSMHSLNKNILISSSRLMSFSIHEHYDLVASTPLSVNLAFLQAGYTHILPIFNQYLNSRTASHNILLHDINFTFNIFSPRGVLLSGGHGSGKTTLLRQLLTHLALDKYNKRWITYYESNHHHSSKVLSKSKLDLATFITESQLKLQKQRYERDITNAGALFIDDVHLDNEGKCHEIIRGLSQNGTIFDANASQFKLLRGFYILATSFGNVNKSFSRRSVEQMKSGGEHEKSDEYETNNKSSDTDDKHASTTNSSLLSYEHSERVHRYLHRITLPPASIISTLSIYIDRKLGLNSIDFCHDLVFLMTKLQYYLRELISFIHIKHTSNLSLTHPFNTNAGNDIILRLSFNDQDVSALHGMYQIISDAYPAYNTLIACYDNCYVGTWSYTASAKRILENFIIGVKTFNNINSENSPSTDEASIGVSIAINDLLHIYDRVICEQINRYIHAPYVTHLHCVVTDYVSNHLVPFRTSNVAGLLEKIRLSRMTSFENIAKSSSESLSLFEPMGYSRNIYGFYKTGHNILPTILTAEGLRDNLYKKLAQKLFDTNKGADNNFRGSASIFALMGDFTCYDDQKSLSKLYALSNYYFKELRQSLSLWHDVLQITSFWTWSDQSNAKLPSLLILQSPCHLRSLHDSASTNRLNVHLLNVQAYSCFPMRLLISALLYESYQYLIINLQSKQSINFTQNAEKDESTEKNSANPYLKLARQFGFHRLGVALETILLFLLDPGTHVTLYQYLKLNEISFSDIFNIEKDASYSDVHEFLPANTKELIEKLLKLYSVQPSQMHKPMNVQTLWILTTPLSISEKVLEDYIHDISFASPLVQSLITSLHPKLNILLYTHDLTQCLQHYASRQKLVVLVDSIHIPDSSRERLSSLFESRIHFYTVYPDYNTSSDNIEKLISSCLKEGEPQHTDTVAAIMNNINDLIEVVHSYLTTSNPVRLKEVSKDDLKLSFLNSCQGLDCSGIGHSLYSIKQKLISFLNSYIHIVYKYSRASILEYINELQPIGVFLLRTMGSFYHQNAPDVFTLSENEIPTSTIYKFIMQALPTSAKLDASVAAQHLNGLYALNNYIIYASSNASVKNGGTWSRLHCIPDDRPAKSFIFSLQFSFSQCGVVLVDATFFSSFLLNHLLELDLAPLDMIFRGDAVCFEVGVRPAERDQYSRSVSDPHTYHMDLSYMDYIYDFFLIYLLENNQLSTTCSELQTMYISWKEFISANVLSNQSDDNAEKIKQPHGWNYASYIKLYEEAVKSIAPMLENIVLIAQRVIKLLKEKKNEQSPMLILFSFFNDLCMRIDLFSNKQLLQSISLRSSVDGQVDRVRRFTISESMALAIYSSMSSTLMNILSEDQYMYLMLDLFISYFCVPYHQNGQLAVKDNITLSSSNKHSHGNHGHSAEPNSNYALQFFQCIQSYLSPSFATGITLEAKFGFVIPSKTMHNDTNGRSRKSKGRKQTTGLSSDELNSSIDKTLSFDINKVSSIDDDDSLDASDEELKTDQSDINSDGDSSVDSSHEEEEEVESFALASDAKHTLKTLINLVNHILSNTSHTFWSKYGGKEMHDIDASANNYRILDAISENPDLFVSFVSSLNCNATVFPVIDGHTINPLEKVAVALVCKFNSVLPLCRDLIALYGLQLDVQKDSTKVALFEAQATIFRTLKPSTSSIPNRIVKISRNFSGLSLETYSDSFSQPTCTSSVGKNSISNEGGERTDTKDDPEDHPLQLHVSISKFDKPTHTDTGLKRVLSRGITRGSSTFAIEAIKKKRGLTLYYSPSTSDTYHNDLISFLQFFSSHYCLQDYNFVFIIVSRMALINMQTLQNFCQENCSGVEFVLSFNDVVIDPVDIYMPIHTGSPRLHLMHTHDQNSIMSKLLCYIKCLGSKSYLIDAHDSMLVAEGLFSNSIISQTVSLSSLQLSLNTQVKKMVNRVRWLLIFFHIAVCYFEECIRNSRVLCINDNTLVYASDATEKALLETIRMVIQDYIRHVPADESLSVEDVTNEIIRRTYVSFDEVYLHHIILLSVYYPQLQRSLLDDLSTIDEMYVKYVFENIFTCKSCRYTNDYLILEQLSLPLTLNFDEISEVKTFFYELMKIGSAPLRNGSRDDEENESIGSVIFTSDRLFDMFFVSHFQLSHKAWSTLNSALLNKEQVITPLTPAKAPDLHQPFALVQELYVDHRQLFKHSYLSSVSVILSTILFALPNILNVPTENADGWDHFQEIMKHFRVEKQMENVRGRNTMVVRPQDLNKGKTKGISKVRRKLGHGHLLHFNTRDCDPLLVHMLSEIEMYNIHLRLLRKVLLTLISACENNDCFDRILQQGFGGATLDELVSQLLADIVPVAICSLIARSQPATITSYISYWQSRHDLLHSFIKRGQLDSVKLYLLSDVSYLLFALKESYSMKTGSSVDKIYLHFDLLSLAQYHKFQQSDYHKLESQENMGCNIRATDVSLLNCRLTGKGVNHMTYTSGENSSLLSLDLLPISAQTSHGPDTVLHIFPSLVEQSFSSEMLLCPCYISPLRGLPSIALSKCCGASSEDLAVLSYNAELSEYLIWVPMNSLEDNTECALARTSLHIAPKFY